MRTVSGRGRSRDGREAGVRLRPVPIDFPQTDQRQRHEDIHELPEGSAQRNLEERLKQQRQNARGNRQLFSGAETRVPGRRRTPWRETAPAGSSRRAWAGGTAATSQPDPNRSQGVSSSCPLDGFLRNVRDVVSAPSAQLPLVCGQGGDAPARRGPAPGGAQDRAAGITARGSGKPVRRLPCGLLP